MCRGYKLNIEGAKVFGFRRIGFPLNILTVTDDVINGPADSLVTQYVQKATEINALA